MKKLVSVIVLSYRNIEGVFSTVDSILKQDYENIELIISDDGTPGFLENIQEITSYIEQKKKQNITNVIINAIEVNGGTVKNINSAINKSNGDYIKLIAAEDIFSHEKTLSTMISFLENSEYDIAFAKIRGVTPDGNYKYDLIACESNYELLKKYTVKDTLNRLYKRDFLPAPACIFSKKIFNDNGLFKEETRLIEDYPYWIRLCMNNVKFGYIDEVLIDYKLSGVSSTGSYSEMFMQDMLVIYEKYIFPYDKRFGIFQPIYNALKKGGLNYYISEAKRKNMNIGKKIWLRIKYLPFHILVKTQGIINDIKNKKRR